VTVIKRLLLGLLGLVILLVIAAFVVPQLISIDSYRGRIEAAAEQATGRKLAINGPLKLTILPQLAISAHDVAFANAQGGTAPQMASVKRLMLELQLLPLLHGRIAIDRFVLDEPEIDLEIDKNGRPNWLFAVAPGGTPPNPAATAPAGTAPPPARGGSGNLARLSGFQLGKFKIEGGKITFRDARSGSVNQFDKLDVTIKLPDLNAPFNAEGEVVWAGETVTLTAKGEGFGKLLAGENAPFSVSLQAPEISFSLDGKVTQANPAALDGTIKLDVPSVGKLATWLGRPIPAGTRGIAALSLTGKIAVNGSKLSFSDAALTLDQSKGTGRIDVDLTGAKPHIDAALDFDKLDVNPYLPPQAKPGTPAALAGGTTPSGGKGTAGSAAWSDDPIDLTALALLDADFSVSASSIDYRNIRIGKSRVSGRLKDGLFEATLSDLALYGGKASGRMTIDGRNATPIVKVSGTVNDVDAGALMRDGTNDDRIRGRATGDLDITSSGTSQRALVQALAGKGKFAVRNGSYKGVDLGAVLGKVGGELLDKLTSSLSGAGETKFSAMTGSFVIKAGIASNSDLVLASSLLNATGSGTIDLPRREMNYRLVAKLVGGIAIPVNITGPLDNPSVTPDLSGAALSSAKGAVKGATGVFKGLVPGGGNSSGSSSGAGGLLKKLF
jgi:AsmA protein